MKPKPIILELALESHPNVVHEEGLVTEVPAVGDFVDRKNSGWHGYVRRRRFIYPEEHDKPVVARVWLHTYPKD